jgi:chromate transporter
MLVNDAIRRSPLRELALLFLKLGAIAFGGPAAHIALMEDEVVRRRRWLTREEFLDYLGASNLIPGPNSTELAIHIGFARAGWPGLLVAGACFILPAALIVSALAWAYVRYGALPEAVGLLHGIKPVVIAIVVQALISLGRSALKSVVLVALGVTALMASALGINELVILFAAAAVMVLVRPITPDRLQRAKKLLVAPAFVPQDTSAATRVLGGAAVASAAASFGYWPLFLVFLKIGSVLFGSGYVLLAFLRADLVGRLGWLTEQQLLDAVAVGQVTPGPVFTTATFIGYVLGGAAGALVATLGIFLPAFVFVALSGPLVPWLRRSPVAGAALDGVVVASLALMATVTWQLGRAALQDTLGIVLAGLSLILLLRLRSNPAWLILGGALTGLIAALV